MKSADPAEKNVRVSSVAVTLAFICMGCLSSPSTEPDPVEVDAEFEIPESPAPWSVGKDGITCRHPTVEPDCHDGWCRIPAGCFIMGSPEDEPGRGATTEDEVATTLTRSFLIAETEVTQKQWNSLIENSPAGTTLEEEGHTPVVSRVGDEYPVDNVSWLEAIWFANELSRSEDRPTCYEFINCSGTVGSKGDEPFVCEDVALTAETGYECLGYRLPTEAEWEYAARAGTRSAYYAGQVPLPEEITIKSCVADVVYLNAIAWHCGNANYETHPVGQLKPNQFGLFDVLGNVMEWVHDERLSSPGEPPWNDPNGPLRTGPGDNNLRKLKGGAIPFGALSMRASNSSAFDWTTKANFVGIRLVRTLQPDEKW